MYGPAMHCKSSVMDLYRRRKYLKEFAKSHPDYFQPIGTMIFCGEQGSGKTLSAVNYVCNVLKRFPKCILVTNVAIRDYPFNTGYSVRADGSSVLYDLESGEVLNEPRAGICVEYDGLDTLKYISNGFYGVIYLIDEIHLELNSLESKNIDIDVMTEISQQRKQRKHIVGTSQVYMRLAKPLREQIKDIVMCSVLFGWLQYNQQIDGSNVREEKGKIIFQVKSRSLWVHKPEYYERYDTFAKMKRYNKEWQGHKRETPDVYRYSASSEGLPKSVFKKKG